ncbi:serpin family protein, partial [Photobacterium swingsii]|uniref:serpin family protein n=1 Tax=Photobacterium swingsii TaxID=680026 RepID=UPI003D0C08A1
VELYKLMTQDLDKRENILISPLSISHSLSMVMAGAKGKTLWEIGDLLQLNAAVPQIMNRDDYYASNLLHRDIHQFNYYMSTTRQPGESILNIKDALWTANHIDIKKSFNETIFNCHFTLAEKVDFTLPPEIVRAPINHWISFATGKMAKNTIDNQSIKPTLNTLLTSVAYFEGKWQKPFDINNTSKSDFYGYHSNQQMVMMNQTNKFKAIYGAELDEKMVDVLELPYDGGEHSMFILRSRSSDKHDFERVMTSQSLTRLMDKVTQEKDKVISVGIPKFSLSDNNKLAKYLKRQGLRYAFYAGADFSKMTDSPNNIDEIVHQANIIVNEDGKKGSKATTALSNRNFIGVDYIANEPFTFIIRDNVTKSILFIGRYATPETSS